MIDLGKKIKRLRAELNQTDFAKRAKTDQSNVSRWEGGSVPHPDSLIELARLAKQDLETFLTVDDLGPVEGEEDYSGDNLPAVPEKGPALFNFQGDEYAAVVRFDVYASAGPGAVLPETTEIRDRLLFRMSWLRGVTRAMLEEIGAVTVIGDSMDPTLKNGDVVLFDLTQRNPAREDVYLVQREGLLLVKRIKKSFKTKTLTIISDNPAYGEEPGVDPDEVTVVGRVFWMGRQM